MTMDILTFIAELAKALAWPISIMLIVFLLRNNLNELLPALKRLKIGALEAEFSEDLAKAEQQAQQANLPPPEQAVETMVGVPEPAYEKYERLAYISPRAAIIEAWRDVEITLKVTATGGDYSSLQSSSLRNTSHIIKHLIEEDKLHPKDGEFLEFIRSLRNRAAHTHDIDLSSNQAYRYAMLASRISARLRAMIDSDRQEEL